jgi:lipoyl(octanoyl) transferase
VTELRAQWLGRVGYRWAWRLQHARREGILAGHAPEVLWLLEHDPVITTGRRAVPPGQLPAGAAGLDVVRTERGGLLTWHGPGQLVGYLLADLPARRWQVRRVVSGVEEGIICWLQARGVDAGRRAGLPGVWVGDNKICAIGMHFRRGVSMHGFALNLAPDLRGFEGFTPCGVTDGGVTSVARELGAAPSPYVAARAVADAVLAGIVDQHAP